jgi:hypothetical protein
MRDMYGCALTLAAPQHPLRCLAFAWRQRLAAVLQSLGYGEGQGYGLSRRTVSEGCSMLVGAGLARRERYIRGAILDNYFM